jgi:hypothetical protein
MKKYLAQIAFLLAILLVTAAYYRPKDLLLGDSKITIKNSSSLNIDNIYFSEPDKKDWDGDDVLGADEVLEPGETIEVSVPEGKWDVKIVLEDGGECYAYDILFSDDKEVWEITNLDCTAKEGDR